MSSNLVTRSNECCSNYKNPLGGRVSVVKYNISIKILTTGDGMDRASKAFPKILIYPA